MSRFTVQRSAIRAEVERRKAVVAPTPISNAEPAPAAPVAPKRWSAKVFVVPAAVAEALAKFASRTIHGIIDAPQVGERHSMRRHRGVYIWRPAMDQLEPQGQPDIVGVSDVTTAETEIRKLREKPLH